MRFQRLSLRNFKCFADAEVDLSPGVTVVHGINGSGKSSLLEATFFALYGATAIDRTLDEIVTTGAEELAVDLTFVQNGTEYHLHRRVRATGDRASTAECTLEGPEETLSGVGDVEDRVRELLRMDAEAFVNSAFVRQGEINKLIEASPSDRERMIDRLLQLGRLETYRERAREARLGVETVLERRQGHLESIAESIAEKSEADLRARKAELESEIAGLESDIEELAAGREEAREKKRDAETTLETHEDRREELETVTERVETLRERIAEAESRREDLAESIGDLREEIESREADLEEWADELDLSEPTSEIVDAAIERARERSEALTEEIMDLRETVQSADHDAETAEERAENLRERAADRRETAAEVSEALEELEATIETVRTEIEGHGEQLQAHRAAFEDAPIAPGEAAEWIKDLESDLESARETETDLRERVATLENEIEEAEQLQAAGKCPVCGQPVEGSPHLEHLEADREELAGLQSDLEKAVERRESIEGRIETARALREREREIESLASDLQSRVDRVAERQSELADRRERIADLESEAAELESEAETADERAEAARERASTVREEIGERNATRSELRERIESLESLQADVEALEERRDLLAEHRETRSDLADRNDERRETLAELRERQRTLESDIDEAAVESARERLEAASEYLERVAEELEEKRDTRDERQSELGAVENELAELERLEDRQEAVAETVTNLESLHEEVSDLESMYGSLRSELRQQNVTRLEALLNETFELVYRNDAYSRIELDGSYELTIYQKDGTPLAPEQLSGGERALFNLSLRAAIYRLLVEGIEGTAPMPPLILDEPTVFLDSGHVSQLVTLVESMCDLGVEQIVVVSHDEELIGAAEDLLRVEKDPTTNRSTVESVSPELPGRAD